MSSTRTGPVLGLEAFTELQRGQRMPLVREVAGLPDGMPGSVIDDLAWCGSDFPTCHDYVLLLLPEDIDELESGLSSFKSLALDGTLVSRDNFPLPGLKPRLAELRRQLHTGRGFGSIRGLDPQRYSVEDLTILQLGLQVHVADRFGRQDKKGNMLVHIVADDSSPAKTDHHRHSTAPITFHNEEAGDIVSWLTRSCADVGGRCIITSVHTIYNVLAASRPDLIRVLMRSDWPFALPKFHCRPVLFHHENKLIMNFGRTPLLGSASHPRSTSLPRLKSSQKEALDAIEAIGQATQLEMRTKPGDIHFINNLTVLHRREGFVNGSDPSKKRHLVRMRLQDAELGWAIPPELRGEWNRSFAPGKPKMWHLQPMPEGFFPLRTQAN